MSVENNFALHNNLAVAFKYIIGLKYFTRYKLL
jgi:hypothetical protein